MSAELTIRKILSIAALVAVMSGLGTAAGFRWSGPGTAIAALAQVDTMVLRELKGVSDTLHTHDREQTAFRDSISQAVLKGFRPLNIFICLNASPKDSALMDLDCDSIVGRARNAAIMRANDRAFSGPTWRRPP
jgi:hypothetical protein